MAKVLTCPACGAPLSLDDDGDDIIECFYCKRHVVVASGTLTQAPAGRIAGPPPEVSTPAVAASGSPRKRKSQKGLPKPVLFGVVAFAVLATGAGIWFNMRGNTSAAAEVKSTDLLNKLELSADPAQVSTLFGKFVNPDSSRTLDFPLGSGPLRRVELDRHLGGQSAISGVTVYSAGAFNKEAVFARLQPLVPHRIADHGPGYRVYMGDAVLDVAVTHFKLWHWDSVHPANADSAKCLERLSALWAVARAAVLEGPAPTPTQLELVNGPGLDDVSALDTNVTVEQAVDEFQKKLPAGWCRMQAGLLCVADVNDARVSEARFGWPNGLKAHLHELKLTLRKSKEPSKDMRAIAGCLEPALGKGEEKVVDYVRGTRTFSWLVGGAGGDEIVLGEGYLTVQTSEKTAIDKPAAWPAKLRPMFAAIHSCPP